MDIILIASIQLERPIMGRFMNYTQILFPAFLLWVAPPYLPSPSSAYDISTLHLDTFPMSVAPSVNGETFLCSGRRVGGELSLTVRSGWPCCLGGRLRSVRPLNMVNATYLLSPATILIPCRSNRVSVYYRDTFSTFTDFTIRLWRGAATCFL
jgi:hypothetical protein